VVLARRARSLTGLDDRCGGSAADDDGEGLVTSLRQQDLRDALVYESALPGTDPDLLAGPFAHVVVDEARS
jgi:hypothetical protein